MRPVGNIGRWSGRTVAGYWRNLHDGRARMAFLAEEQACWDLRRGGSRAT